MPHQNSGSHDDHGGSTIDDPDAGKDLSHLVPTMGVGWTAPPSFNLDPNGGTGGGQSVGTVADSGPILFDAATVRATENTLLTQGRNAVANYETLRARVDAVVHSAAFWGPKHPDSPVAAMNTGSATPNTGYYQSQKDRDDGDTETLAQIGDEFARHIGPAMQKALAMQSNALELLGNYVAMINNSGQSYGRVDRASRFPEPPGSVTS
ncbi:hypothetical protein ACFYY2_03550 [Streptomyces sp. NPDC001822]|uniref:hypothetical protein n=1 Tax=Streptomyces sp. NPDC001822 TaxID=3364614 RepID=UPI0036BC7215